MPNDVTQFYNPDDGCIYFYDEQKQRYRKVCDIPSFDELPLSIKRQIKAANEAAGRILRMPDGGGTMPKLSHYTMVDGRLYCLNETTGTLVEVVLKDVPIGPLYGEVAIAMLSRGASPQTQGGNND